MDGGGTLEAFPEDQFNTWCADELEPRNKQLLTDLNYECEHAFGHATFYSVALAKNGWRPDACTQIRPKGFTLDADSYDWADRLCNGNWACENGVEHSYNLLRGKGKVR